MDNARETIHAKVVELARQLGRNAKNLGYDEEIPKSGLLDSASLMELIMWYEGTYDLCIEQNELTLENFGSIEAMVSYLERNKRSAL